MIMIVVTVNTLEANPPNFYTIHGQFFCLVQLLTNNELLKQSVTS